MHGGEKGVGASEERDFLFWLRCDMLEIQRHVQSWLAVQASLL